MKKGVQMNPFFVACITHISYNEKDEKQETEGNIINHWLFLNAHSDLLCGRFGFPFLLL